MSSALPSPNTLLTTLLTTLPHNRQPTSIKDARPTLLTLHVLFPHHLLPALDLLDRTLVSRFSLLPTPSSPLPAQATERQTPQEPSLYFVRSAQQQHGRFITTPAQTRACYEVRPAAWNCSCPAFAFEAFPLASVSVSPSSASASASASASLFACEEQVTVEEQREGGEWRFGGLSRERARAGVPVCKHLLACVLVERCPGLFGGEVEERVVSEEELAAWCAGWGD